MDGGNSKTGAILITLLSLGLFYTLYLLYEEPKTIYHGCDYIIDVDATDTNYLYNLYDPINHDTIAINIPSEKLDSIIKEINL